MAVGINNENAQTELEKLCMREAVNVACINSPNNVTLSGDTKVIDELADHFAKQKVFARILRTDNKAYHSKHMELVKSPYEKLVAEALLQESESVFKECSATVFFYNACPIGNQRRDSLFHVLEFESRATSSVSGCT